MNERIKDMWEEATVSTWPRPGKFTAGEYDYHLAKFAELIVRECMDIAKRTGDNFGSWNPDVVVGGRGGTFCVYHNIKNWFGVEE